MPAMCTYNRVQFNNEYTQQKNNTIYTPGAAKSKMKRNTLNCVQIVESTANGRYGREPEKHFKYTKWSSSMEL